jgi:hypothetical protein
MCWLVSDLKRDLKRHILYLLLSSDQNLSKINNHLYMYYIYKRKNENFRLSTHVRLLPLTLPRIIQSLYYSPASRCIDSSSESADRGRSSIQVTLTLDSKLGLTNYLKITDQSNRTYWHVHMIENELGYCKFCEALL